MRLDAADVNGVDLERLRPFIRDYPDFYKRAGDEHYRLLAYLATRFRSRTIVEIGTHRGDSAMALSLEESNRVESFDIIDAVPPILRMRENVRFHQENLFDPAVREKWRWELLSSALCFIDIDPHEGTRECELLEWFRANDYQGRIVLDDIWYFDGMRRNLWYKIDPKFRFDATLLGHWSGTGIVSFCGKEVESDRIVQRKQTQNWTMVTGYFDLTERSDANQEISARPSVHYLEAHAASTLALDKNLIVFCEPKNRARVEAMRPPSLLHRTRFIAMSFGDLPMTRYFDDVVKTRIDGHCARDPRNTASYYLFCVARFAMMKRALEENPFHSSHFAWINICIERMGFKNLYHLDRALATQRSRFSTCYIDYVRREETASLQRFFGMTGCRDANGPCGRCSLCSGFFTGDAEHMSTVVDLVEKKFVECLAAGYGHSDEQLLTLVHAQHPALFECYPGDYQDMITNYASVVDHPEAPIHHLIRHSFEAGDHATCYEAAAAVWRSYSTGGCALSDADLAFLLMALQTSKNALAGAGQP